MLNPNAREFVPALANRKPAAADPSAPGTSKKVQRQQAAAAYAASMHAPMYTTMLTEEDMAELSMTQEELEELEAADEWVRTMADLDEAESEHLITMALQEAPDRAYNAECKMIYSQMEGQGAQHRTSGHSKKKRAAASGRRQAAAPAKA